MKKIGLLLLSLILIGNLHANPMGGIGLSLDYLRYYDSSFSELTANELVLSASGRNTFDSNEMFGINYSVGYGFPFNEMTTFKNVHMATSAIVDFKASSWLTLSLSAGLHNTIYIFKNAITDQLGFETGLSLIFTPVNGFEIETSAGYVMPLVSFYEKTVSPIALDSHIMMYGITFSYAY